MTVLVTGMDLTLDDLVTVARREEAVELTEDALDAMSEASALAEHVFERGLPTYGLTTGLGAQKRTSLRRDDDAFSRRQIEESHVGQGPEAPRDVVRAAMLVLVNQYAGGSTCVRPAIAERLVAALNAGETPPVKALGSLGASDLAPMADIARGLLGDVALAPGEGLALINSSAFGTAQAALALADAARLVDAADIAGALALEGFAANLSTLDPAVADARPDPALRHTLERFRDLLQGSYLWQDGAARHLQDPLTFRSTLPVQAAGRVALDHALERLRIELNAAQGNPLVSVAEGRIFSASAYEVVGALGGARLRPRRPGNGPQRCLRAQRQAARHAMVRPAHRVAAERRSGPRPQYPRHHCAVPGRRGEPACPAGVLHRPQHSGRGGHRGPRQPPAAVGAAAGRDGEPGRGYRRDRAAGRRSGCGRERVVAARAGHRRGVRPHPRADPRADRR